MNVNKCLFCGNLTRDPELKYLPSGSSVCEFGMAINDRYKAKDGDWKEHTSFLDFACFGPRAEVIKKYCHKGSELFVETKAKQDRWETDNGQKRSKIRFTVDNFEFGARTDKPSGSSGPAGATATSAVAEQMEDDDLPF